MSKIKDDADQKNLKNQDGRHTDAKAQMSCLMAKCRHAKKTSDAAAKDGKKEQGTFPEAPFLLYRPALIHTEGNKTCKVNDE